MLSLSCMLMLQIAATPGASVAGPLPYDAALERSAVSGRPLVIFVTADWCVACQRMKAATLAPLHRAGQLGTVEFAVVDFDRQRDLARQLVQGGPIPQLVRYDRDAGTWYMRRLVGAQEKTKVAEFLRADLSESRNDGPQAGRPVGNLNHRPRSAAGNMEAATTSR